MWGRVGGDCLWLWLGVALGRGDGSWSIPEAALEVAKEKEAGGMGVAGRARFVPSDLLSAVRSERFGWWFRIRLMSVTMRFLRCRCGSLSLGLALFAGPTGLEVYERLIPEARSALVPRGLAAMEIGHGQRDALADSLEDWDEVEVRFGGDSTRCHCTGLQRTIGTMSAAAIADTLPTTTKDFQTKLDRLAPPAIHSGLGLAAGQQLVMTASLDAVPLARRITEHAYKAGASLVTTLFADEESALLRYRNGSEASFDTAASWLYEGMAQAFRGGAARLAITGGDPSLLSKEDPEK